MDIQEKHLLVGDELLVAVFESFPKEKRLRIKKESSVMKAFYLASKNPAYTEFFANYPFDKDGVMPWSKAIGDGYTILDTTLLIDDDHTHGLALSPGITLRFNAHIKPKLSPKQRSLLEALSREVRTHLLLE